MKKVTAGLMALSLFSSVSAAETSSSALESDSISKTYLGLDIYQGESNFDLSKGSGWASTYSDFDSDLDGFRLKFGKRLPENVRYQAYFKSEEATEAGISGIFDENIYGIGLDVIKTIPVGGELLSIFGLAGAGLDWTELKDHVFGEYSEDSINAFHIKLGFGASYQINKSLEVITGLDWQYRSWQEIEILYIYPDGHIHKNDLEIEDISTTFYAGINLYF